MLLALALALALGPRTVGAVTLFSDDFEDGGLSPWSELGNDPDRVGVNQDTAQSGSHSMFLRWDLSGSLSPVIDASGSSSIDVSLWVRRGDAAFSDNPEPNEDLYLQYLDDGGSWQTLDSWPGGGTAGEILTPTYSLPADGLHPNLQFRFVLATGSGSDFDYWHIDDFIVSDDTPISANLLAEYRMDANVWFGAGGEVTDSSGNGRDGTALGGATTGAAGPALAGDPGTCNYGTFDGSDDHVSVSNLSSILDGTATLTFWIRTTQTGDDAGWMAPGVTGVEQAGGTDDIFWGWIDASGRIGISVGNDYGTDQKSSTAINDDNWHHVALSRDADTGDTRVYVDGVLETTGNTGAGIIGTPFSRFGRIKDTDDSHEYFQGDLDELRVYDSVLTGSQVQSVRTSTRPCPAFCPAGSAFSDSFEDGDLGPWQAQGGGNDAGVSADTSGDGSRSAFLRGNGVRITSPRVDLSTATGANAAAWIRRGDDTFSEDPDGGEDLRFEYRDSSNNWVTLQTYAGAGAPGEIFAPSISLPADAFHANFRIRFVHEGGQNGDVDYWHVDNVCLTANTGLDHYAIAVGSGAASTCQPRAITITAEDSSNNAVAGYTGTVDLSTSSGHGTWSVSAADGTLTDATADDGAASYGFVDSDDGTIELDLSDQHADDLTITVTEDDGSPSSTSATLSFRDNAFVIDSVDSLADDVVAGRDHALRVALWRRDPVSGDCAVADAYNDAGQPVKLWVDRHPDDPGGAGPEVAQQTGGGALPDTQPGANNVELDFSAGSLGGAGRAPLTLETSDVGKYALSILDDTSGFAVDAAGDPRPIAGGSPDYVARPFAIRVTAARPDGTANPAAPDANGDVFVAAGADFDVTVTAVQYDATDDADGDGFADGYGDGDPTNNPDLVSGNSPADSFGQEGTNEEVELRHGLWQPSGPADPPLRGGEPLTFDSFTSGAATATTGWPEVGIIELRGLVSGYLGSGRDVPGRSNPVGRFVPADFAQTVADAGMFANACSSTFTYIGQRFGYLAQPVLTITARDTAGGTTENYTDGFANLEADEVDRNAPSADNTQDGTDGTPLTLDVPSLNPGSLTGDNGVFTYTFSADDRFAYARELDRDGDNAIDSRVAPFVADLTLEIAGIDETEDNVSAGVLNDVDPVGTTLRFGRLVIGNAAGAEIAPVEQVIRAEYFAGDVSGEQWNVNTDDDGCTAFTLTSPGHEIELENDDDDDSPVAADGTIDVAGGTTGIQETGPIPLDSGTAVLTFEPPGTGNTGWVDTTVRLGVEHPYLGIDDDGDGVWDGNPTGRVTFGIYTGPAGRILLREVPAN